MNDKLYRRMVLSLHRVQNPSDVACFLIGAKIHATEFRGIKVIYLPSLGPGEVVVGLNFYKREVK
jgi:hypothetical protein